MGNGSLINIWTDRWLPSETTQKVCSPRKILPTEATVADLMDFSPHNQGGRISSLILFSFPLKLQSLRPFLSVSEDLKILLFGPKIDRGGSLLGVLTFCNWRLKNNPMFLWLPH